jgi:hypothetical protein
MPESKFRNAIDKKKRIATVTNPMEHLRFQTLLHPKYYLAKVPEFELIFAAYVARSGLAIDALPCSILINCTCTPV